MNLHNNFNIYNQTINQYTKQFDKIYALTQLKNRAKLKKSDVDVNVDNIAVVINNISNRLISNMLCHKTNNGSNNDLSNNNSKLNNISCSHKCNNARSNNGSFNTQQCIKCNSFNLFIDPITANKVCGDCGVLLSKIFNTDAEWRYYGCTDDNKHSDPTRCGLPIDELLPKSSLTTKIKYVGTKYISLVRLHKWNIIHPEERSLFTVFKYIDNIFKNVNLSITNSAILQAKEYYKILSAKDDKKGTLTRGIIRKSFIAACIFVSCKNNQTPIQKAEIAQICGISKFAITKGFKKFSVLEKNKNIQLNKPNDTDETIHNYLQKFSCQLNFTQTMKEIAHIICNRLPKLKLLQDTNDISISAGLLYYVSILFMYGNNYGNYGNNERNGGTISNKGNLIHSSADNERNSYNERTADNNNNLIHPNAETTQKNNKISNEVHIVTNKKRKTRKTRNNPQKYNENNQNVKNKQTTHNNIQKRGANDIQKRKILNIINTSVVTLQKVYRILQIHKKYILIGLDEFIPNNSNK